jgi:hypothetical protein
MGDTGERCGNDMSGQRSNGKSERCGNGKSGRCGNDTSERRGNGTSNEIGRADDGMQASLAAMATHR